MLSENILAAVWGGVAGLALVFGAFIGYFVPLPHKVVSSVMAFGSGVLISALSFELMGKAAEQGGMLPSASGFCTGVLIYSLANYLVSHHGGALYRKRALGTLHFYSNAEKQKNGYESLIKKESASKKIKPSAGAGIGIALGALLDGIPEAAAIGVSMTEGKGVAMVTVLAVFLSNIPEGLSSSAGMKKDGKSAFFIFSLWIFITVILSISAYLGLSILGQLGGAYIAFSLSLAAGAILVMIIQTMIPEAFEGMHQITGPIAALGFLITFSASEIIGVVVQ